MQTSYGEERISCVLDFTGSALDRGEETSCEGKGPALSCPFSPAKVGSRYSQLFAHFAQVLFPFAASQRPAHRRKASEPVFGTQELEIISQDIENRKRVSMQIIVKESFCSGWFRIERKGSSCL